MAIKSFDEMCTCAADARDIHTSDIEDEYTNCLSINSINSSMASHIAAIRNKASVELADREAEYSSIKEMEITLGGLFVLSIMEGGKVIVTP